MTTTVQVVTPAQGDPAERKLVEWLERTLGGDVTSIQRQNRWRRAWFVELTRSFGTERLYVRGDRQETVLFSLEHEYNVMRVLAAEGLPVPHLYGMCPDPKAIVMAHAPGRHDLSTASSEEERRSVMDHYMELLARIHALDPAKFESVGVARPVGAEAIASVAFDGVVANYRRSKLRAEPVLEYVIGWLRRNRPRHREDVALVCADPAQFLFDNGRVTALLDFELAHLGDPIHDLAALQLRNTSEPLGDVGRALRRYEEITGKPIDAEAFDFHAIQFSLATPMPLAHRVMQPLPSGNPIFLEWFIQLCRLPLEGMARREGVPLPSAPIPERRTTRFSGVMDGLGRHIRDIQVANSFNGYKRDTVAKLADYVVRASQLGPAFEEQDLAETQALLGKQFSDWQEADAALESFVQRVGPEMDKALIPFFYRRVMRQQVVFEPIFSRSELLLPLKSLEELVGGPRSRGSIAS
jgi:aminoglycoside phosphotransferase (APT) family kinase protein